MARSLSLLKKNQTIYKMKNFNSQYQKAKKNANEFMKRGQITQYFEALLEMNKYKRLMVAVVAN